MEDEKEERKDEQKELMAKAEVGGGGGGMAALRRRGRCNQDAVGRARGADTGHSRPSRPSRTASTLKNNEGSFRWLGGQNTNASFANEATRLIANALFCWL